MKNSILVVSDIDGALIDHPYLSASTFEHKAETCRRLIALLRNHRLCLCSGRPRRYYESFQKLYTGEVAYPWCLVAEFGSEVIVERKTFLAKEQDPLLSELVEKVRRWAGERGILIDEDDGEDRVDGLCFESKRQILDIDWDFGDRRRNEEFLGELTHLMAAIADSMRLRYVVYPEIRRINVCSAGFYPKVSIWSEIRPVLGEPDTIWVFGDEQLDVAMFQVLKRLFSDREVFFAATHPRVKGDASLQCGIETIDFIENLLNSK